MKKERENRVREGDLSRLGRREKTETKTTGRKKEKGVGDRSGKKRRQRSFMDQWANWKETERRRRRCTESTKKVSIRTRRSQSLKERGQERESIQRSTVNYGKVERERKRTGRTEKEGEKAETKRAKTYTILGVKTGTRETDMGRVRKLRSDLEGRSQGKRGRGRKRVGRKTEKNERVWMNEERGEGSQRRQRRSSGGKRSGKSGWTRAKERYQGQRRQSLSRRRVNSRVPRARKGKKEEKTKE